MLEENPSQDLSNATDAKKITAGRVFVVISFSLSRKGYYVAGIPEPYNDCDQALGAALALNRSGKDVVLLEEQSDPALCNGLRLVAHFGKMPPEILQLGLRIPI